MSKMQAAVGGAIDSSIISPLGQNFFLKSKNNHKNSKKAFSVAEAMIALLIGSVALGMAAPMITKQIKQQNFQDVQFRRINQQLVPRGAVMFFHPDFVDDCPDGWSQLNSNYNGRYFKVAGDYKICNKAGEKRDGTCKGREDKTVTDNNAGIFFGDAIREMTGEFTAYEMGKNTSQNYAIGVFSVDSTSKKANGSEGNDEYAPLFKFAASRVVPTADENRPRSVSMLACVKN